MSSESASSGSASADLRRKVQELEQFSRQLEPSPEDREATRDIVVEYAETFLNNIESIKAFQVSRTKRAGLLASPIAENGTGISELIGLLAANVDQPGLNPASGGHLAYIPGGGIYYSALAD